jgi:hypothetical protein
MEPQSITNQYIKLEDLRALLLAKFGAGNFFIVVSGHRLLRRNAHIMLGGAELLQTYCTEQVDRRKVTSLLQDVS